MDMDVVIDMDTDMNTNNDSSPTAPYLAECQ